MLTWLTLMVIWPKLRRWFTYRTLRFGTTVGCLAPDHGQRSPFAPLARFANALSALSLPSSAEGGACLSA